MVIGLMCRRVARELPIELLVDLSRNAEGGDEMWHANGRGR